jgi:hypothetical protein
MKLHHVAGRFATLSLLFAALIVSAWGQQPGPGGPGGVGAPQGAGAPGGAGGPGGPGGAGGPGGPPANPDIKFSPYVDIDNGVYKLENADKATLTGKVTNTAATGIKITSKADNLNIVYVKGAKSNFTLTDATIDTYGNGGNDFVGIGSAIMSDDGATLTIKNAKVTTNGVITPGFVNTGKGTVAKIYDSKFVINGGTLPKDYVPKIGPGMMEPPAPLLIHGTARGVLTMGSAKTYAYNVTIIAEGWGAFSTDAAQDAYAECNKCDIQVNHSGYGTYSDNGAHVAINDSKVNAASYGAVIAGEAQIDFNNVNAAAGVNGVMIHSVRGKGPEIGKFNAKGGKLLADYETILIKSANADISLDGVEMVSKLGTLIHARKNEDSAATQVNGQKVTGIRVTMKNEKLEGNITNDDKEHNMTLTFTNSSLKGAINMAEVNLDAASKWTATGDSKVLLSGNVNVAQIDADKGVAIDAVCGKDCALKGSYNLASGGTLKIVEGRPKS